MTPRLSFCVQEFPGPLLGSTVPAGRDLQGREVKVRHEAQAKLVQGSMMYNPPWTLAPYRLHTTFLSSLSSFSTVVSSLSLHCL